MPYFLNFTTVPLLLYLSVNHGRNKLGFYRQTDKLRKKTFCQVNYSMFFNLWFFNHEKPKHLTPTNEHRKHYQPLFSQLISWPSQKNAGILSEGISLMITKQPKFPDMNVLMHRYPMIHPKNITKKKKTEEN